MGDRISFFVPDQGEGSITTGPRPLDISAIAQALNLPVNDVRLLTEKPPTPLVSLENQISTLAGPLLGINNGANPQDMPRQ